MGYSVDDCGLLRGWLWVTEGMVVDYLVWVMIVGYSVVIIDGCGLLRG